MGIDYTTYVGPYFRCTPTVCPVERSFTGCNNSSCKKFRVSVYSNKFCEQCGMVIEKHSYTEQGFIQNSYDIADEVHVRIRPLDIGTEEGKKYDIFIPNVLKNAPRNNLYISNKYESAYIDLTHPDISTTEICWLKSNFSEELCKLNEKYGSDNVKVCWGVLCAIS